MAKCTKIYRRKSENPLNNRYIVFLFDKKNQSKFKKRHSNGFYPVKIHEYFH